jgi:hypothetical protein
MDRIKKKLTNQGSTMRPKHLHLGLTSVKSMWFKSFMSESIVRIKIPNNQCQNLNWKIRSVRERKCSGNIYSPSGYQYRIAKNKLFESTDHEAGLSDGTLTEVWSQNSDKCSGSKAEMHKFHVLWKSRICATHLWFQ